MINQNNYWMITSNNTFSMPLYTINYKFTIIKLSVSIFNNNIQFQSLRRTYSGFNALSIYYIIIIIL